MLRFEDILEEVERFLPRFDEDMLRRAYVLSAHSHRGQLRSSGEPYLIHPLNVAMILAQMHLDEVSIATGLLHDVLEDTPVTRERLEELFGKEVAHLVDGVTKIGKFEYKSKEAQQAETFRKMLLATTDDIRVILVKLADRLHNMRTLEHLPEPKRRAVAAETLEIYAPLANRLGIGRMKGELEDLSFKFLYPEEWRALNTAIDERMKASSASMERVRMQLSQEMEAAGVRAEVTGRVKRLWSMRQKLIRQAIPIDQLYDVLAFRVIVESREECYKALGVVHQAWRPVPGRFKDYIAMPKANLYQSLHTSVVGEGSLAFEVQIRTRDMDAVAEQGIAAHWKYKEGKLDPRLDEKRVAFLRQILETTREVKDPREFLSSLKLDLFPDEVYTFSPRGEVFAFPRGATPVDFAYRIHTDVGHRCVGARLNGRLVPLKTPLQNGDRIEILTSPVAQPSRDWLTFVVTSRARNKIKVFIHSAEKDRDIGFGKLVPKFVVQKLFPAEEEAGAEGKPEKASGLRAVVRKILPFGGSGIRVKGDNDLLVALAECCKPVPGDDVIGYITRGRGVSVHASACPNVKSLLVDPGREIEVEWESVKDHSFTVDMEILTEDRKGMLARITKVISDAESNIQSIEARAMKDGNAVITATLTTPDRKHLDRLLIAIRGVPGVTQVRRKFHTHRPAVLPGPGAGTGP